MRGNLNGEGSKVKSVGRFELGEGSDGRMERIEDFVQMKRELVSCN